MKIRFAVLTAPSSYKNPYREDYEVSGSAVSNDDEVLEQLQEQSMPQTVSNGTVQFYEMDTDTSQVQAAERIYAD